MSTLRKFAAQSEKSPSIQTPLVTYPSSESMDGDSADENLTDPTENGQIENGHASEENRTSVDKYFLGTSEVNDNIPDLDIPTEENGMEPCGDQIQCESSNVDNPVFPSNDVSEIFENPENNSVNILLDGSVPNQPTVSYSADLPDNAISLSPPVHQMTPPVQAKPVEPPSTMMILDDEEPPQNIEPNQSNGQVAEEPKFPEDVHYYMPNDKTTEVVKAWGQFPQWARWDSKNKAFTLPKRAILEGRDLNSGIEKLRIPPPGKPNVAYLANEQIDFNCFYEFVERTRTHPERIEKCAFISSTTWVAIAPESKAAVGNRKIVYDRDYQDKNSPKTRLGEPVLKAFYGCTGRPKYVKYFREKIDYFEIDQIFIPIIEEEHWSLAIVNHPMKAFKKLLQGITRQQIAEEEEKYSLYSKNKELLTKRKDEFLKEANMERNELEAISVDVDAELEKFKLEVKMEQEKMLQQLEEQQAQEEAMDENDQESHQEGDQEDGEPSDDNETSDQVKTNEDDQEECAEKVPAVMVDSLGGVDAALSDANTDQGDKESSEAENPNDQTESNGTKSETEQMIEKLEEQTLESKEEMDTSNKAEESAEEATVQPSEEKSSEPVQSPSQSNQEEADVTKDEQDNDNESCPTDSEIPDGEANNLESSGSTENQNEETEQNETSMESTESADQPNIHVLERIKRIYHLMNEANRFEEKINSLEEITAPEDPTEDDPVIYILCSLRSGEEKGRMKCDAINHVLSHMLVYEHDNDKRITAFDKYREEMKNQNPDIYDLWTDKEILHWKDLLPFSYRFPLVPHQVNDYDCGLFVSKFIQMYLDKDNRPPMTADKNELETIFPPREIFDLKFKYRNILRELRGEPIEEHNHDGEPEANGYLATLEESLNWGREKKDLDRRLQYENHLMSMRSEDSDDYSSDEEDSELDDDLGDEDEDHIDGDLYGDYQIGDLGRRDEYPDSHEESIQPHFQLETQNNTNEYHCQNDEEESEDDTTDGLANALANIRNTIGTREIKKSDHSLNEHVPDASPENNSDLPQQENANQIIDDSSKQTSEQNSEVDSAPPEKECPPDQNETLQSDERLQTPTIENTPPNAEIEKELEPQPKLPKPSSPAVHKSAVRIKTTLDTPVKDKTEIPKTRQKTSDESKEILDKKLKGKQDRVLALQLHSEINIRPQRRSRQPPPTKENVTPSRKIQKSPKVTNRRKTIAVSTIAIPTKPVRRKLPPTPKTEPRNQIKRRREVSTSSTTKQTSKQQSSEPTEYSDELSLCMKIQSYNSKNRGSHQKDISILKTLSETESTLKTTSSPEEPEQNGLDSTS